MKNAFRVFPLALLAAATLQLKAEEPKANWSFNVGAVIATGDTKKKVTEKEFGGFELGLAYTARLDNADLGVRFHGNLVSIDGKPQRGLTKKNLSFIGGLDLVKTVGNFEFFGGLSVVEWNPSNDAVGTTYTARPTGGKLAFRVGAEYAFLPNFSARVAFTQTEYNVYLNPSYITTGIVYKF